MEKKAKKVAKKTTTVKKADTKVASTKSKAVVAREKAKEIEELKEIKIEKKEAKKAKPKHKYESARIQSEDQKEIMRFFIVLLVVVLMVTAIYFLTRIFVTKDLGKKKGEAETEEVIPGNVNYSVAIVGQILNRPYDSYYVIVFDTTGDKASDAQSLMISYNSKEERKHLYRVDLSNQLNKAYYDKENENPSAQSVNDFKFGDLTLLYIRKGKVEKYITDIDKMKTELGIK
jgi:hypothetical protein